jgi:DNA-binding transcriptional LysR family regulator
LRSVQSIDLNLLAALDALLEEGSVTRAAERMHLSAPAMSRALGRIREATGDAILVRAGRTLVPTPRAIAVRARVRAALHEARSLLLPPEPVIPRAFSRSFTLRVDDAVTAVLGPPLLARIRAHAPGVTLVFIAEGAEDVAALRDGEVDLDIGEQGPLGPEIRTRKLLDDEYVVLSRRAGAAARRRMSLAEFAAAEHVIASRRGRRRGPVDDLLERQGLARRVRAVVPNQLAAAVLVAQSDVVALVSRRFAASIRGTLAVTFSPAPLRLGRATVALAWHPRLDADPAHAWLRDEIGRIANALAKRRRPHRNGERSANE